MVGRALILLLSLFLLAGCEKVLFPEEPEQAPLDTFDALWQVMDERYAFFDFKEVDWDAIGNQYRSNISNESNTAELYYNCADMLKEVRDGHVNLWAPFDYSRYDGFYRNSPQNFNYTIIDRNYLRGEHLQTGPLKHYLIDSVGYVYYPSMSSAAGASSIDFIMNLYEPYKGLIIDVRDNGGGNPENGFRIAQRWMQERTQIMDIHMKSGPGDADFSDADPVHLEPDGIFYAKPIVVLTNRSCFSATNDFAAVCKVLPNVVLMGDTTGGGGGIPAEVELPNGWVVRLSVSQTLLPDGFNIEDGIPPDIQVDMDATDEANGIDTILERALDLLN